MNKISVTELSSFFKEEQFILLTGLGFDERSLVASNALKNNNIYKALGILHPSKNNPTFNLHKDDFTKLMGSKSHLIGNASNNLMDTIDQLQVELQNLISLKLQFIFDITSLSHELLVAIIGLLENEKILSQTTIIYTAASEYSYNQKDNDVWLSRGVTNIRSILGFPGMMYPSRKLHLIIMAGFEVERAAEVIMRFEPNRLTIAFGAKTDSVSTSHHTKNSEFVKRLQSFIDGQDFPTEIVHQFEFSCINPFDTKTAIKNHLQQFPGENVVICPLNTKLSTVGVALAALESPDIQICYAQVAEYNTECYAKAGHDVRIVSFKESV